MAARTDAAGEESGLLALQRVEAELASVETACMRLQDYLAELAPALAAHPGSAQLQEIDHVTQRVTGVRQFLAALGRETSGGWKADGVRAAAAIVPSDLAARLSGRAAAPAASAPDKTGDIDLF
ncbi:hypothetical protein [Parvularcula oceani]|uniref:hypothetical protein n=1 Tax=Parvularcula oceani TaxID=1247963 RepID=UPI0004E0D895|nr:hypothetical protein [Parvularcula oceani]